MEWTPRMLDLMKRYEGLHRQTQTASHKVGQIEKEKLESEAADLWNKAD
jgi:hypothetical protein